VKLEVGDFFLGIDIIQNSNASKPNKKLAKLLINYMRNKGILLSTDGPYDNVIKIKPPLVFTKLNVDQVCKNLETFFKKL
jgi:4-aminobutyrate aminotransferase-like enzyme